MTVDEAIICLSDMKIKFAIPKAAVQARLNNDALDMAIETLKCSEIPNNSDTISRQQAVDFVGSMNMCDEISNEAYEKLTSYLNELPSAEPERKTGHWIYGESEVGNDGYYCSECGNFVPWIYEESAMNFIREYKFCPNCGADMRGEGAI